MAMQRKLLTGLYGTFSNIKIIDRQSCPLRHLKGRYLGAGKDARGGECEYSL